MSSKHLKQLSCLLISVFLTLGLSLSLQSLLAAWAPPTSSPPSGNVSAPLNESAANQAKLGGLSVGGNFAVSGNSSLSGNVGIGTAGPAAKLDVRPANEATNTLRIYRGIDSGYQLDYLEISDTTGWATFDATNNESNKGFIFKTSGAEKVRILNNGNVGIGTTGPNAALHLGSDAGTAASGIQFGSDVSLYRAAANVLRTDDRFDVTSSSGVYTNNVLAYSGSTYLTLSGNGAGVILSGGNVGIGTVSPTEPLDILTTNASDPTSILVRNTNATDSRAGITFRSNNQATNFNVAISGTTPVIYTNGALSLNFGTNNNTNDLVIDTSHRVLINNGNVGIGTTNPQRKLHIIQDSTGTPTTVAVENINTTNGNGATLSSLRGVSTGAGAVGFKEAAAIVGVIEQHNNATYAGSIRFFTTNEGSSYTESLPFSSERMRIDPAGNIGIGTTTPGAKLEVSGGAIKASGGLIIETRTGSNPASPVNGQIWLRTDCPGGAGC